MSQHYTLTTIQTEAWWQTVAAYAAGRTVPGKVLTLTYVVYLVNRAGMADTANYEKCIADCPAEVWRDRERPLHR